MTFPSLLTIAIDFEKSHPTNDHLDFVVREDLNRVLAFFESLLLFDT